MVTSAAMPCTRIAILSATTKLLLLLLFATPLLLGGGAEARLSRGRSAGHDDEGSSQRRQQHTSSLNAAPGARNGRRHRRHLRCADNVGTVTFKKKNKKKIKKKKETSCENVGIARIVKGSNKCEKELAGMKSEGFGAGTTVGTACPVACGLCNPKEGGTTPNQPTQATVKIGDLSPLKLSIKQITSGNKHHLFGYIGQSLTIPWNGNGQYILTIEGDFHDRLPGCNDVGRVCLIDTQNGYKLDCVDETRGWNPQQGTMFYWNPHAPDTQFFFNDRDANGKVFTVLYDIEERRRIREYKFDDTPVANGGVCPKGRFFYALNYGRMARLRPVTGYAGAHDYTRGERAPDNDGVWRVDIATGERALLISFKELSQVMNEKKANLYINHALSSRKCKRIYFFARGEINGKDLAVSQPFVMTSSGRELKEVKDIGGHPEWYDETTVLGADGKRVIGYNVVKRSIVGTVGKSGMFDAPKGDLSLSPNRKMFVNGWDTKSGGLHYHILRLTDGANAEVKNLERGPYDSGRLRIDAAPRWNRRGDQILVPGWTNKRRQLFVITVEGAAVD